MKVIFGKTNYECSDLWTLLAADPDHSLRSALVEGIKEALRQRISGNKNPFNPDEIHLTRKEAWEFVKLNRDEYEKEFGKGTLPGFDDLFAGGPMELDGCPVFGAVLKVV